MPVIEMLAKLAQPDLLSHVIPGKYGTDCEKEEKKEKK
jgi:hypothetical protein